MSIPTSNLSIVLTQQLGIVLEKALLSPMLNESEKLTITAEMGAGYATPLTLRRIHQIYGNDFNALEACRGSKLVYLNRTEPKKDEHSPEYLAHKATLLKRDEERRYNKMVYGAETPPTDEQGVKKIYAAVQDQAAIGLNVIVATLAAFGIGYYFAAYYNSEPSFCMIVGTVAATAVMLLEMVLFIARAAKTT